MEINILLPIAGKSKYFQGNDAVFPKPLTDIMGKTMLEIVLEQYNSLLVKNFIFIVNQDECDNFGLDTYILNLLPDAKIIKVETAPQGAVCSSLLAVDHINTEIPLLIANGDQTIDNNLNNIFNDFINSEKDCGLLTIQSNHPRFSFIQLTEDNNDVMFVAEKEIVSNLANTGYYLFRKGSDFVTGAFQSILNQNTNFGNFYLSSVLNELILKNRKFFLYQLNNSDYHSFYNLASIQNYIQQSYAKK